MILIFYAVHKIGRNRVSIVAKGDSIIFGDLMSVL